MTKAKEILSTLIIGVVSITVASHGQDVHTRSRTTQQHRIHLELINMSGKSREAHLRQTVVELPVAHRVQLLVRDGESIRITSRTDQKVARMITAASADDGRVIPVN